MLKTKRILSVMLAIMMLIQTLVIPSFAAEPEQFVDFPNNSWSTEAMTAAVENGLITGTSETTIEPRKNLTRAEFAAIVTRAFGATKTADISHFKDVEADDWFYDSVAKVVQMGVMNGTGETTFEPNAFMKREDVILSLARILFVDGTDASVLDRFSDRGEIDTWAIAAIAGMVAEDYVNGYEDGTIRPKSNITREELAQLFHNMFKTYISEEGEYDSVASEGSVIVRSKGVTLRDVTINGDLVIADGVGDGDFRLTNVHVKGKIIVRGGEGTVYFTRVTADGKVIINDPNGTVNFYNYRDEAPFANNLVENTPATFLTRKGSSSSVSGGAKKYDFYIYRDAAKIDLIWSATNKISSYKIPEEAVPADEDMAKTGYTFGGWTNGVETKTRDQLVGAKIGKIAGKWVPVYVPLDYTIDFRYADGTDAGDDVVVTAGNMLDEADIPEIENLIGWTTQEGGTEAEYINDDLTADLIENIFGEDEDRVITLYAVVPDPDKTTYTVSFVYADDTDRNALDPVTKELLDTEDYTLTEDDVYDVEYFEEPDMYEFLGWTTTVDGTDYIQSADLRVSIKTLASVYYAQFKHVDEVLYVVEHYFEQLDGTYAIDETLKKTENFYEFPGEEVTATATTVEGFHENEDHADRVVSGTVLAEDESGYPLTLKIYYDRDVLTVQYFDLGWDEENPVYTYNVKYGGTAANFYNEEKHEDVETERADYLSEIAISGYGKNYDDAYLYNEAEINNEYEHEHAINYNWYAEDEEEDFVLFDEEAPVTKNTDVYSKIKKLNVRISFPDKISDGIPLTINIPYEESTRFLDSIRDVFFVNDNIATYPELIGIEEQLYDIVSGKGEQFFDGDGLFNDEYEINKTDVTVYFYQMMGGKQEYEDWLWDEVEKGVLESLDNEWREKYNEYKAENGLNCEQMLEHVFVMHELDDLGTPPAETIDMYNDSKAFIDQSRDDPTFFVTKNNEFIMEKVEEKISSLATLEDVIDEYGGGRIPEGLINRLPMDIIADIYEPRVNAYLNELNNANMAVLAGGAPVELDSGITFDVNLVSELLIPIMEYAENAHTKAVNKAVASGNRAAELIEKYYVDNPYTIGAAGNYGVINYAFNPDFYVEDADNDGFYTIKSFKDIYTNVVMPEAVESIDALLWLMDEDGGNIGSERIVNLARENEDLILALYNHPNKLMARYAEEGLPEDMIQYYDDLLENDEIRAAVEKLDNKIDFDMMFFVEEKLQNATLEMYYLKVLDRAGVPVETILDKYTNSRAYKEITSAEFEKVLDVFEKCWDDTEVEIDGVMTQIENYYGTTDFVFDNLFEKIGKDTATISFKGFGMSVERFFADTLYQTYEEANK